MGYRENYLKNRFEEIQVVLTDKQIRQFLCYYDLLVEKNKVMNLTGITEFEEVVEKHFVDSLSVVFIADLNDYNSMIDVGTGAGFPGIPIKIVYPHLDMVLLDSLNKRVMFLDEVVMQTGIENVRCVHARAEDAAKDHQFREKYDICVSRAVADLAILSELCLPFIKKGGVFISYKSGNAREEIKSAGQAVGLLGGKCKEEKAFQLPGTEIGRILVKIEKEKETPGKYPRKPGIIKKKPL